VFRGNIHRSSLFKKTIAKGVIACRLHSHSLSIIAFYKRIF